jgi:hypothetical protein
MRTQGFRHRRRFDPDQLWYAAIVIAGWTGVLIAVALL